MKRRFSEEQIIRILKEHEAGVSAKCLSPLKLCHYLLSSGVYGDGAEETFRRRYFAFAA